MSERESERAEVEGAMDDDLSGAANISFVNC